VVALGVVVALEVDAEGDGHVRLLGGGGDDHLLGAGLEVLGGVGAGGEEAGRLDHDVDAEVAPGQSGRIALGEDLDLVAAGDDRVAVDLDPAGVAAEDRVVLEQVGHRGRVDEVVDRDEVDVRARLLGGPEDVAPDAAETVDADLHSHEPIPPTYS
jgi:hypothetical protein